MFLEHPDFFAYSRVDAHARGSNSITQSFYDQCQNLHLLWVLPLRRLSKGGDCIKRRARDRRTHSSKYRAPAVYGSQPGWGDGSAGVFRELLRTAVADVG
jgi:hypothetical protein